MKSRIYLLLMVAMSLSGCNLLGEHYESLEYQNAIERTPISQTYKDLIEKSPYYVDSCPLDGEPKLLVIPVWFSDSSEYIKDSIYRERVKEDIEIAYFGSEEDTGWHSVSSYYATESQGKLNLKGTVSDWYECRLSIARVGKANSVFTASLAKDAADWYFEENPSESRSDYDLDGNGYLDGVMLIYGAPSYQSVDDAEYSNYTNLWAYTYWKQDRPNQAEPTINSFFWSSYDMMYGESKALSRSGSSYNGGDTSHCEIDAHTYIHEMGHMFGLEDYYDYSAAYTPAGGFSMQDYNRGGHDPYSLMSLGWADPYIPSEDCTISLRPFAEGNEVILLTPSWNEFDSPFDEYLLLELYAPVSLNRLDSENHYSNTYPIGPSKPGIRLWHVDSRLLATGEGYGLTSDAKGSVTAVLAFSNSSSENGNTDHLSPMGQAYYDHNLLQLIRNDASIGYNVERGEKGSGFLKDDDLFHSGDSFSMGGFQSQFINGEKLNNEKALGWSFSVKIGKDDQGFVAQVTLNKS